MRNLLLLAIALRVVLTDADAKHLTFDVTEEDFRNYFEIPETAVVDLEKMSSNFAKDPEFNFESVKRFMNGKEQKLYKKLFPEKEEPAVDGKVDAEKAEAKAKKDAEKAAKDVEKNKPKPLSKSQEIQVYHSNGKTFKEIKEAHPDWSDAHIRNALHHAKNNPEVVAKTLEQKDSYDSWLESQNNESTKDSNADA